MKYMLLVYSDESSWTPEERLHCMQTSQQLCEQLAAEGKLLGASPLQSVTTASSVRVREGKRQVTVGPFAETTEQLGGFYLLEVDNLDEVISIAGQIPPAKKGTIEIRPLSVLASLPPSATFMAERCSAASDSWSQ